MISRFILKVGSIAVLWLAAATAVAAAPTILVLGDSLSAGYGLATGAGWVNLLQQRLQREAYPHLVVNASVSGDTSSGGLARLPAALDKHKPAIVLIELGGNDGLRGLPLKSLRANLDAIVVQARRAGARPLVLEMRMPPNYGAIYADGFQKTFADLSATAKIPLVPFFLAPLMANPGLFQDDGIHPTAAAQPLMLDAVWLTLKPLLNPTAASR